MTSGCEVDSGKQVSVRRAERHAASAGSLRTLSVKLRGRIADDPHARKDLLLPPNFSGISNVHAGAHTSMDDSPSLQARRD